jgi:CAAX protease family protein
VPGQEPSEIQNLKSEIENYTSARLRMRRYMPLVEALLVLVVTFVLAVGLRLPTLWFLVPLTLITLAKRPYGAYGLTWRRAGSWRFHLAVIGAVFLPYVIGHYAWAHWWSGASFHLRLPADLGQIALDQTLLVGLPEEFFFRGYVQTQCDMVWKRPYRFLGARWGVGLPLAALLFATCHVPTGGIGRVVVFFPGMLYGWLRARTESIAIPTLYHAGSNVLMRIMLDSLSL